MIRRFKRLITITGVNLIVAAGIEAVSRRECVRRRDRVGLAANDIRVGLEGLL